ncbi:fungal-specific transcription factor domain-containing protein [Colletotrichum navitas]|uniref:Fungal-specific transcription factor domain-containing protein n=1 Tax=Colletotrichum navitas TaxID=681940 RepID=A0AAD8UYW0_9PEZI|nr:fungal-specific transcription factor domain-containing protein [Colletotrichum navitas]KAK1574271.1 fungal-specific transcription factor domain-containing protein [Colletotrichum navitas]
MPTKKVRQSERRRCVKACGNCKRRKERCDGQQPCRRCVIRRVEGDCAFAGLPTNLAAADPLSAKTPDCRGLDESPASQDHFSPYRPAASFHENGISQSHRQRACPQISHLSRSAVVPQVSRLIADGKGRLMFIGDAANLAFLKVIRRLVRDLVGSCPFTDDPLRHIMVEATPEGRSKWIITNPADIPAKPSDEQARYLLRWYLRATNCILDIFDEAMLRKDLENWLRGDPASQDEEAMSCIFFLALGIGAQRCPEDRDADSEKYFHYGRFLAVSYLMENPTYNTVRSYVLITIYLLGASRRNSAFMHLGVAVRAAYTLGIHRKDNPTLFSAQEQDTRERLWRALRVLDLFLSVSLGRPLATSETRDTAGTEDYSASLDLCAILESILNDVYAKRMVSTDALERISEQHRRWAAKFSGSLAADGVNTNDPIDVEDETYPNMGLYYMKEAYYWSIMLLSRPFLIDFVSRNVARSQSPSTWSYDNPFCSSPSDQLLVYACVDSAIRTVELLADLIPDTTVAKRHPFLVNSVFVSALVLGLAVFGDLDSTFPLDHGLNDAQALLRKFSRQDPVANRELSIVEHLQSACALHREKRVRKKMEFQRMLVGELFGSLREGVLSTETSRFEPSLCPRVNGNSRDTAITHSEAVETSSMSQSGSLSTGIQTLTPSTNILIPISPRTLLFDSYGQDMPFFPTMDASMAHLSYADDMMLDAVDQTKSKGFQIGGFAGLQQYFNMITEGDYIFPKLKQLVEVAVKYTDEGEKLFKVALISQQSTHAYVQ